MRLNLRLASSRACPTTTGPSPRVTPARASLLTRNARPSRAASALAITCSLLCTSSAARSQTLVSFDFTATILSTAPLESNSGFQAVLPGVGVGDTVSGTYTFDMDTPDEFAIVPGLGSYPDAVTCVMERGNTGETYNIGGNNEWANIDIIKLLCERMDELVAQRDDAAVRFPDSPVVKGGQSSDLIEYVTDRAGHDRRYAIDASKIMTELGYSPRHSFETGLEATLAWYLDNEEWWKPLL